LDELLAAVLVKAKRLNGVATVERSRYAAGVASGSEVASLKA